jgi:hypothetical protein
MMDLKVCNTEDLRHLANVAKRHDLNRQMPAGLDLDPDGNHVLSLVLWGHNAEASPALHHRVLVLAKVRGSMEPETFHLDVLDRDWRRLLTVEQAKVRLAKTDPRV